MPAELPRSRPAHADSAAVPANVSLSTLQNGTMLEFRTTRTAGPDGTFDTATLTAINNDFATVLQNIQYQVRDAVERAQITDVLDLPRIRRLPCPPPPPFARPRCRPRLPSPSPQKISATTDAITTTSDKARRLVTAFLFENPSNPEDVTTVHDDRDITRRSNVNRRPVVAGLCESAAWYYENDLEVTGTSDASGSFHCDYNSSKTSYNPPLSAATLGDADGSPLLRMEVEITGPSGEHELQCPDSLPSGMSCFEVYPSTLSSNQSDYVNTVVVESVSGNPASDFQAVLRGVAYVNHGGDDPVNGPSMCATITVTVWDNVPDGVADVIGDDFGSQSDCVPDLCAGGAQDRPVCRVSGGTCTAGHISQTQLCVLPRNDLPDVTASGTAVWTEICDNTANASNYINVFGTGSDQASISINDVDSAVWMVTVALDTASTGSLSCAAAESNNYNCSVSGNTLTLEYKDGQSALVYQSGSDIQGASVTAALASVVRFKDIDDTPQTGTFAVIVTVYDAELDTAAGEAQTNPSKTVHVKVNSCNDQCTWSGSALKDGGQWTEASDQGVAWALFDASSGSLSIGDVDSADHMGRVEVSLSADASPGTGDSTGALMCGSDPIVEATTFTSGATAVPAIAFDSSGNVVTSLAAGSNYVFCEWTGTGLGKTVTIRVRDSTLAEQYVTATDLMGYVKSYVRFFNTSNLPMQATYTVSITAYDVDDTGAGHGNDTTDPKSCTPSTPPTFTTTPQLDPLLLCIVEGACTSSGLPTEAVCDEPNSAGCTRAMDTDASASCACYAYSDNQTVLQDQALQQYQPTFSEGASTGVTLLTIKNADRSPTYTAITGHSPYSPSCTSCKTQNLDATAMYVLDKEHKDGQPINVSLSWVASPGGNADYLCATAACTPTLASGAYSNYATLSPSWLAQVSGASSGSSSITTVSYEYIGATTADTIDISDVADRVVQFYFGKTSYTSDDDNTRLSVHVEIGRTSHACQLSGSTTWQWTERLNTAEIAWTVQNLMSNNASGTGTSASLSLTDQDRRGYRHWTTSDGTTYSCPGTSSATSAQDCYFAQVQLTTSDYGLLACNASVSSTCQGYNLGGTANACVACALSSDQKTATLYFTHDYADRIYSQYTSTLTYDASNNLTSDAPLVAAHNEMTGLVTNALQNYVTFEVDADKPTLGSTSVKLTVWDGGVEATNASAAVDPSTCTLTASVDELCKNDTITVSATSGNTYTEQSVPVSVFNTVTIVDSVISPAEDDLQSATVQLDNGAVGLVCGAASSSGCSCAGAGSSTGHPTQVAGGSAATLYNKLSIQCVDVAASDIESAIASLVMYQSPVRDCLQSGSVTGTLAVTDANPDGCDNGTNTVSTTFSITLAGKDDPPRLYQSSPSIGFFYEPSSAAAGTSEVSAAGSTAAISGSFSESDLDAVNNGGYTFLASGFPGDISPLSIGFLADADGASPSGAFDTVDTLVVVMTANHPSEHTLACGAAGPSVSCSASYGAVDDNNTMGWTVTKYTGDVEGTSATSAEQVLAVLSALEYTNNGRTGCGNTYQDAHDTLTFSFALKDHTASQCSANPDSTNTYKNVIQLTYNTKNNPPTVSGTLGTKTWQEGVKSTNLVTGQEAGVETNQHAPVPLFDPQVISFNDVDSCDRIASVVVTLTPPTLPANYVPSDVGQLVAVDPSNLSSYNPAVSASIPGITSVSTTVSATSITLTLTGSNFTVGQAATALTYVAYLNSSDTPLGGQYAVDITINDNGDHGNDPSSKSGNLSSSSFLTVTATNDAPVLCPSATYDSTKTYPDHAGVEVTDSVTYPLPTPHHTHPWLAFSTSGANGGACEKTWTVDSSMHVTWTEPAGGTCTGTSPASVPLLGDMPLLFDADLDNAFTVIVTMTCAATGCDQGEGLSAPHSNLQGSIANNVITLQPSGTLSFAGVATFLADVTYTNTNNTPTSGSRAVDIIIGDHAYVPNNMSSTNSYAEIVTAITVKSSNDPPTTSCTGSACSTCADPTSCTAVGYSEHTVTYSASDDTTHGPDRRVGYLNVVTGTTIGDDTNSIGSITVAISNGSVADYLSCAANIGSDCSEGSWDEDSMTTANDEITCGYNKLQGAAAIVSTTAVSGSKNATCSYDPTSQTLTITPAGGATEFTTDEATAALASVYFSVFTDAPAVSERTLTIVVTDVNHSDNTTCGNQTTTTYVLVDVTPENDPATFETCQAVTCLQRPGSSPARIYQGCHQVAKGACGTGLSVQCYAYDIKQSVASPYSYASVLAALYAEPETHADGLPAQCNTVVVPQNGGNVLSGNIGSLSSLIQGTFGGPSVDTSYDIAFVSSPNVWGQVYVTDNAVPYTNTKVVDHSDSQATFSCGTIVVKANSVNMLQAFTSATSVSSLPNSVTIAVRASLADPNHAGAFLPCTALSTGNPTGTIPADLSGSSYSADFSLKSLAFHNTCVGETTLYDTDNQTNGTSKTNATGTADQIQKVTVSVDTTYGVYADSTYSPAVPIESEDSLTFAPVPAVTSACTSNCSTPCPPSVASTCWSHPDVNVTLGYNASSLTMTLVPKLGQYMTHQDVVTALKTVEYVNSSAEPTRCNNMDGQVYSGPNCTTADRRIVTVLTDDLGAITEVHTYLTIEVTNQLPQVSQPADQDWYESSKKPFGATGATTVTQLIPTLSTLYDPDSFVEIHVVCNNCPTGAQIRCRDTTGTDLTGSNLPSTTIACSDLNAVDSTRYGVVLKQQAGLADSGIRINDAAGKANALAALSYVYYVDSDRDVQQQCVSVTLEVKDLAVQALPPANVVSQDFTVYLHSFNKPEWGAYVSPASPFTLSAWDESTQQGAPFSLFPAGTATILHGDSDTHLRSAKAVLTLPSVNPNYTDEPGALMCGTDPSIAGATYSTDTVGGTAFAVVFDASTHAVVASPAVGTAYVFCEVQDIKTLVFTTQAVGGGRGAGVAGHGPRHGPGRHLQPPLLLEHEQHPPAGHLLGGHHRHGQRRRPPLGGFVLVQQPERRRLHAQD